MFLVIGETSTARRVCGSLEGHDRVMHLLAPNDHELTLATRASLNGAAILVRDDVEAVRYAFALAHLDRSLSLVASVFDRTIAEQLKAFLPQVTVFSPAVAASPAIAAAALDPGLVWIRPESGVVAEVRHSTGEGLDESRRSRARSSLWTRLASMARLNHRGQDTGTGLLVVGMVGLTGLLVIDWLWLAVVQRHGVVASFLEAARVVATVGPGPTTTDLAYGVWTGVAMLATIAFTAVFTAGLVDRIFEPRLLGLVGSRTAPRRDHVIVVGMGQVGVRLCELLKTLGVPVVGVERDRASPWLPLAKRLDIPVLVGDGTERSVLKNLHLSRSRSLVAVGSNDLDNIAVAVAAAAVSPSTRVVLRAGEQEAIAETRSLLPLGAIRDVTELAAAFVLSTLLGDAVAGVLTVEGEAYVRLAPGRFCIVSVSRGDHCTHRSQARCCADQRFYPH